MFRIRNEQLDTIAMKRFIDRVESTIVDQWFMRKTTSAERARLPLREMIEHGVDVGRGRGLETEQELALFVLNMIEINPQFHQQPRIEAVYADRALTPVQRHEKLAGIQPQDWEAAAAIGDADAYWSRVLPNRGGSENG